PAITALMAIFSILAGAQRGGTTPMTSCGFRLSAAIVCPTRSSVGGIIGNPSVQPFSSKKAFTAQRSSSTSKRSACSTCCSILFPVKRLPFDRLLCGCQVANAQMLLCFFFLLNHPRPKRDLLLCVARHTAVTLTRNAPLSKAPSPGISVSRVEPSGVFVSRFCLSSSRSLGRCLLLGQRSRMNFFSHHIRSLLHQDHGNPDTKLSPIPDAGQKLTGHNPADARHTHHILDTLGQFRIVLAEAADLSGRLKDLLLVKLQAVQQLIKLKAHGRGAKEFSQFVFDHERP